MNLALKILVASILAFFSNEIAFGLENSTTTDINQNTFDSNTIIATNDTFNFTSGCGNLSFGDNVFSNDIIPEGIVAKISYVVCSDDQLISFGTEGNFVFSSDIGFNGTITFRYHLCDQNDVFNYDEATTYINIISDFDCDGIPDAQDIDDDNDGIPDTVEGINIDSDNDGISNNYDIDSDNDGIPDIREWQTEQDYILPSGIDINRNGWDDEFEDRAGINYFIAVDTDKDKIPDFLDNDSDNDNLSDLIEATDLNLDSLADFNLINSDFDHDGLDDVFDIVRYWLQDFNSAGSNVSPPDHNNNGIADFREKGDVKPEKNEGENETLTYDNSLITFPNPTSGLFSFQIENFSNEQESYIKIFNLSGDLKLNVKPSQSVVNVDLTHLESGIYVVKMVSPNLTCSKKLILQNH